MKKSYLIFNLTISIANIVLLVIFLSTNFKNKQCDIWADKSDCVYEVVLYQNDNLYGYATCFVIDRRGLVMTNKHVANIANTSIFIKINNEIYPASVEKMSVDYDMAILSVDYTFSKYLKIIEYKAKVGEKIYTIGNPNGIGLLLQQGIISGEKKYIVIDGLKYLVIQVSLALNEGNSGGPLFDENGNVIGIVSFRMRDKKGEVLDAISFCYSSDELISFISLYNS